MTTYVTRPFLPPLVEFLPYLEQIWDTRILSNCGPYHVQFEAELCKVLKVQHVSLFGNGTLALLVALRALEIENAEIITTPYSFVATSSSIIWSGNTPVFVDIEADSMNIDPSKIEQAISPRTKAILAVHCYGHPCRTDKIGAIARQHGLKVIYDAAHAFGIEAGDGSILNQGDLSILSFHATKTFNTFEGGAIVCHSPEMKACIDRRKNFGFSGEVSLEEVGINAKMSEFNAALGLLQLKYFDHVTRARDAVDRHYRTLLRDVSGVRCIENTAATKRNYSYFPVLIGTDYPLTRDELYELLKAHDIYARRYFYPLITHFPSYSSVPSANAENLPVATMTAQQILCFPIFPELHQEVVENICRLVKQAAS
jgi:dTDP-4-amino-4,6-dideoxygalactose transaminase